MNIKRLSIKSLTTSILLLTGILSIILSHISGNHVYEAAKESQLISLQRVIQVATSEIMQDLRKDAYLVSSDFSNQGPIPEQFNHFVKNKVKDKTKLIDALNDPFISGFVGAYNVELLKLKVYDLDLNFIAQSKLGAMNLPQPLPESIYDNAYPRKGSLRNKSIDGLWIHQDKTYYSMLVPIGGIFISGYLEVIFDPLSNLIKISEKMSSPITIQSGSSSKNFYYKSDASLKGLLPIEYALTTESGQPAFNITSYENIDLLSQGVKVTIVNTILMFLFMVMLVLFLSLILFKLFVFKPINMLLNQINHITAGNFSEKLQVYGLKEIDVLAQEFNKMSNEVHLREEELKHLSGVDELTKIANRRTMNEVLKQAYMTGCRKKYALSILLVDIDYFKQFNDTYGHLAGDDCLKKVARSLQNSVYRSGDLVARYGGEEFVIILPDTSESGAQVVAEKIMCEISQLKIQNEGSPVSKNITVSIGGYTLLPSHESDPETVLLKVDELLYQAKKAGRNQFILNSD